MRALGIDLGSRRIGVAVSDSGGLLATPYEVIPRRVGEPVDHARIIELVAEVEAEIVVIGLPLGLDGSEGAAATDALREAERLGDVLAIPVETYDERLTTVTADRSLMGQQMRADERRKVVDKVAAAIILQAWLDGRRNEDLREED